MKYEIRSSQGTLLPYAPRSYDMACRVAFALRSSLYDCAVNVIGGRCVSETFYSDKVSDAYAARVSARLLA